MRINFRKLIFIERYYKGHTVNSVTLTTDETPNFFTNCRYPNTGTCPSTRQDSYLFLIYSVGNSRLSVNKSVDSESKQRHRARWERGEDNDLVDDVETAAPRMIGSHKRSNEQSGTVIDLTQLSFRQTISTLNAWR